MHDTMVKLKDGRTFIGPIWEFRPSDGYCTLVLEDEEQPDPDDDRLWFRDMDVMVTKGQRIDIHTVGDQDELDRARKNGWSGS